MKRTVMLATLSIAGCASNAPSQDEYNDVAQAIGSTMSTGNGGGEVASFSESASLAVGDMPEGLTAQASGHVTGQHFGVEYDYVVSCTNAAGQTLAACDPTTDKAHVTVSWSGSLALPNVTASVDRTGDWTLSGIQSGSSTFAGEGTFTFDITVTSIFRTATATYHLDYDAVYDDVKLNSSYHPIGGSIHYSIAAEHTVTGNHGSASGSFDVDAVVTFSAAGTATLTLDGSHHYIINLSTGVVSRS